MLWIKKCFYCGKGFTKKNGIVKGVQLYKHGNCHKQFIGWTRIRNENIWSDYVFGKQTYAQLAEKYSSSIKTVQRLLHQISVSLKKKNPRKIIVLTDTTDWGRVFGLMLFKDAITKENLLKYYGRIQLINTLYIQEIEELKIEELMEVVELLTKTDKWSFVGALSTWFALQHCLFPF